MTDLYGLEVELTLFGANRLLRLERARLSALHSGNVMTNVQKRKFNPHKPPTCDVCGEIDDRRRWLKCPKYQSHRCSFPWNWREIEEQLPDCAIFHLLVPWQPILHLIENWCAELPLGLTDFQSFQTVPGRRHFFLEGTCRLSRRPRCAFAAWGVIHAGTGEILATSPLGGSRQAIDRAELSALVSALHWCLLTQSTAAAWSDSKSTVMITQKTLASGTAPETTSNGDLWNLIWQLCQQLDVDQFVVKWVPSHQSFAEAADSFEERCIYWNDRTDRAVDSTNLQRSSQFWLHLQQAADCWDYWIEVLNTLRAFYFSVAAGAKKTQHIALSQRLDLQDDDHTFAETFIDLLPPRTLSFVFLFLIPVPSCGFPVVM